MSDQLECVRDFPEDFSQPWKSSDSILWSTDHLNKRLHVNRAVLGSFSTYFHTMFFGKFAEGFKKEIEVDCEYEVLLEILKVIHSVDRKYAQECHTTYSNDMLIKLYQAAEKFTIPAIMELYRQQFNVLSAKDQFEVVIRLNLPNPDRRHAFMTISHTDFLHFVTTKQLDFSLSLEEFEIIRNKEIRGGGGRCRQQ